MSPFSQSYAEARRKFVAAAQEADASLTAFVHPTALGSEGEELAIDVARVGPEASPHVLMVTSGVHGVEGFCGAGAQVALLRDSGLLADCAARGVALLLVHAVNPYGFSHCRRVNEDNVDLNRNFMDFDRPLPHNGPYAEVAPVLLPAKWPPSEGDDGRLTKIVAERGMAWFQAAVSRGQYEDPDGLFFGGTAPVWSHYTFARILARYLANRRTLRWIDIHTGLGPWGYGEPIHMGPDAPESLAAVRAIWGREVTSIYDGSSSSAQLTGMAWQAVARTVPDLDYAGIALEFGTVPAGEVLEALRGDHWLHRHPEADANQRALIRHAMWRAFYGDADDWRDGVVSQVTDAVRAALHAGGQPGSAS